jgi:hypothetical protein
MALDLENLLAVGRNLLPRIMGSEVAVAAPGEGPGYWVGASSAVEHDGVMYLAYRLRYPVELGRGQGVVLARSEDGVKFREIGRIEKDVMDAESLERPALVRTPEGTWRLYLSCATTGTKHWRVELLEADDPAGFDAGTRRVVLPGDKHWGVKDTVIQWRDGRWQMWATCHPLDEKDQEDRMVSRYATSADGVVWEWAKGTALKPRPGAWDQRGARVTAVRFVDGGVVALYDGRASAAENYEERTGIAVGAGPDVLEAVGPADAPLVQSPEGKGLRYIDVVPLAAGGFRLYYEMARPDGAHELRTEVVGETI